MASTGIGIIDWLLNLLGLWGYLIVFGFTVLENLFVLGTVTPGETVVLAAAAIAANGDQSLLGVWGASVMGTMVGSNISYFVGRRAGFDGVRGFIQRLSEMRLGRLIRLKPAIADELRGHFHTEGAKTILIARFAAGVRNFVPATAGAMHMPVFWFELYTLLGAIGYTSLVCLIGRFLGENMDRAQKMVSRISWGGLAVMVAFVAILWIGRKNYQRTQAAKEVEAGVAETEAEVAKAVAAETTTNGARQ